MICLPVTKWNLQSNCHIHNQIYDRWQDVAQQAKSSCTCTWNSIDKYYHYSNEFKSTSLSLPILLINDEQLVQQATQSFYSTHGTAIHSTTDPLNHVYGWPMSHHSTVDPLCITTDCTLHTKVDQHQITLQLTHSMLLYSWTISCHFTVDSLGITLQLAHSTQLYSWTTAHHSTVDPYQITLQLTHSIPLSCWPALHHSTQLYSWPTFTHSIQFYSGPTQHHYTVGPLYPLHITTVAPLYSWSTQLYTTTVDPFHITL